MYFLVMTKAISYIDIVSFADTVGCLRGAVEIICVQPESMKQKSPASQQRLRDGPAPEAQLRACLP